MAIYISLASYTDQGIKDIKNSPKRADAAKKLAKALGGKISALYLTIGAHDLVAISEFKDDATAAKFALTLGSKGNVRTTTLKAFPETEFRKILKALP